MNRVAIALLLAVWLLAWGDLTIANVVTGLALIALLLVAFPMARPTDRRAQFRPVAVARLALHVLRSLVVSNALVGRQVLSRRSRIHTGVITYEVAHDHDIVIALIANIIALTPGTMTVDATRDPALLQVHFLLLDDVESARRSIARLEELVVAAVGFDERGALA
jgi:multicomponent Na+:H+ antiporter subunit E